MSADLETKIDEKRRPTLPRAVMDASGIEPGEVVQVRSTGPGRVELVTRRARIAEALAFLRDGSELPVPGNSLDELRRAEQAQFANRLTVPEAIDDGDNAAGQALLTRLGL